MNLSLMAIFADHHCFSIHGGHDLLPKGFAFHVLELPDVVNLDPDLTPTVLTLFRIQATD